MEQVVRLGSKQRRRSESVADPIVYALTQERFQVEDCIGSSLISDFVRISTDTNPIHTEIGDAQAFEIPCEFLPMHGMLMTSRLGGLIWRIIRDNSPEEVRPVILDGVPRFKKFMRTDEPFVFTVKFFYSGSRGNRLLFRLSIEVAQCGQLCMEGETRMVIYKKKQ